MHPSQDIKELITQRSDRNRPLKQRLQLKLAGYDKSMDQLRATPAYPILTEDTDNFEILDQNHNSYAWLSPNQGKTLKALPLFTCGLFAYVYPSGHIFAYHAAASNLQHKVAKPPSNPFKLEMKAIDISKVKVLLATSVGPKDTPFKENTKTLAKQGISESNIYIYYNVGTEFSINGQAQIGCTIQDPTGVKETLELQLRVLDYMQTAIQNYKAQDGFNSLLSRSWFFSQGYKLHTKGSTVNGQRFLEQALSSCISNDDVITAVSNYLNNGPGDLTDCSLKTMFLTQLRAEKTRGIKSVVGLYSSQTEDKHYQI